MTEYASEWRGAGACLSAVRELFFPLATGGPAAGQISTALLGCAGCTVRQQCLDFALETNEAHGIWGGTTPEERIRARRRSRRHAARRSFQEAPDARAS